MGVGAALDAFVAVPAGRYELGEPGEERPCELAAVLIGRWPVVNAELREFLTAGGRALAPAQASEALADHPATGLSRADAEAFCAWMSDRLGRAVRLPSGAEWEAAARGTDGRPYP